MQLQTAVGARSEERMLLVTLTEKGSLPEPESAPEDAAGDKGLTLKEAYQLYERTLKPTLKPSTAKGYETSWNAHILPRFGDWPLGDIDRATLVAFDQELARAGLSPSTRNNIAMPLRTAISNAIELGEYKGKTDFPKLNRVQSKVYEPPSVANVEAVLLAADAHAKVAFWPRSEI